MGVRAHDHTKRAQEDTQTGGSRIEFAGGQEMVPPSSLAKCALQEAQGKGGSMSGKTFVTGWRLAALFLCLSCGHPEDGKDGSDGKRGRAGTAGVTGPQGPAGNPGERGVVGSTGANGATGPQGPAGAPCTVIQVDDYSVLFVCPDGSMATLKNQPSRCKGKKD
jgi:hypothetical protein